MEKDDYPNKFDLRYIERNKNLDIKKIIEKTEEARKIGKELDEKFFQERELVKNNIEAASAKN